MKDGKVVMLGSKKISTRIIYNGLKRDFQIEKVIIEDRMPRNAFLRRRIKRLGWWVVIGQILFRVLVSPFLEYTSRNRTTMLKRKLDLDDRPIEHDKVINVDSVNSDQTIGILRELQPKVIIVCGTRIIENKVLTCTNATFINMHTGITPLYRGVYGAYWSLVQGNREACGVTIHLVDTGIDTGSILGQAIIHPERDDNVITYALLQFAAAMPLFKKVVSDILADRIDVITPPEGESKLWSHPTLLGYLWRRIRLGVR
jgi:folate-dependent phosphoribosylglycinamide formyltransferase PurN